MSQVYATEPQTTGRVILQTTHGPIDINLWCKECPTTTRAFLQLCLDGYFDGIIFHRILSDFLIQCGSTRRQSSSTIDFNNKNDNDRDVNRYMYQLMDRGLDTPVFSTGANAITTNDDIDETALSSFFSKKKLELSSRIRFNHRGQVALALPLDLLDSDESSTTASDLSSLNRQFFITLDEAPFLNTKHVVFGTVSTSTIFNAIRIGKTHTADEELGLPADLENAPMITSVKIDFHPFHDLVISKEEELPWKQKKTKDNDDGGESSMLKKRRKKRKGKRDLNVLSFGGEMEEQDDGFGIGGSSGMSSSHDVLPTKESSKKKKKQDGGIDNPEILKSNKNKISPEIQKSKLTDTESTLNGTSIIPTSTKDSSKPKVVTESRTKTKKIESTSPSKTKIKQHSQQTESATKVAKTNQVKKNENRPKISAVEARRLKYMTKKNGSKSNTKGSKVRDDETMSKLFNFRSKMLQVQGSKSEGNDGGNPKEQEKKLISRREDTSLASRMARRAESSNDGERETIIAPVYSGQVLDDENDDDETTQVWMKTKFNCRKHIDHSSGVGGDGRKTDDYKVVDDRDRKRSRGNGNGKHSRKSSTRESKHR